MTKNGQNLEHTIAQEARSKSLNERLAHVGNAFRELKKAPILSAVIGASAFASSLFIGELFSDIYSQMNPLGFEDRSEMLTQDLMRKSEDIEGKVVEITHLLTEMNAGDINDPKLLQEKISELLDGINGIRPDLSEVANLRNEMFLVTARQKDYDIDTVDMSPIPDIMIKINDGVTLCKERYTLSTSHSGNPKTQAPRITLTSPTGESIRIVDAGVGSPLVIDDTLGRLVVVYQAHEIIANEAYYSFDLTCPS